MHAGVAVVRAQAVGETGLDDLQRDVSGDGRAGGRAEEGGERAIWGGDDFGAEGEAAGVGFFQRLHADAGVDETPVGGVGFGVEDAEGAQARIHRLNCLLHEEADEDAVVQAGTQKRGEVTGAERSGEVGEAAGAMEKLGRPRGEGTEEQDAFTVEVADVEVRAAEGAGVGRR